jgi:type IV pilus assembly protein PilB
MAQRLVRKICESCKHPVTIAPEVLAESALNPAEVAGATFYEGAGCIECGGTGFKGRMAICELLDLTDHIREIILDKRPISEVKRAAKEQGMRLLRESAVERVLTGLTTLREINKVTFVE